MEFRSFLIQISIIAIVLCVVQFAMNSFIPKLTDYQNFFWISHIFFFGLSVISFFGGKYFVKQRNKNTFFQFMMLLIFTRLAASATLIIGYFQLTKPDSKLFLLPFFLVYITYTIYEVFFLSKIGRES